jgi:hypothetical protein
VSPDLPNSGPSESAARLPLDAPAHG